MHQQTTSTVTPPTTQENFKRSFMRLNTEKATRHADKQRPLLSKAQSMAVSGFTANYINYNSYPQEGFLTNSLCKQQNVIDSNEECNGKFISFVCFCCFV